MLRGVQEKSFSEDQRLLDGSSIVNEAFARFELFNDRLLDIQYDVLDNLAKNKWTGGLVRFLNTKLGGFLGLGVGVWVACAMGIYGPLKAAGVNDFTAWSTQQIVSAAASFHLYRIMPWRNAADQMSESYLDTAAQFGLSRIPAQAIAAATYAAGLYTFGELANQVRDIVNIPEPVVNGTSNLLSFVAMGTFNFLVTDKFIFNADKYKENVS